MAATVKTRVLIISDTHGAPLQGDLPKADLLIHCGDLSMTGGYTQYQDALHMISQVDAPVKLVIAGNHDYTLDQAYVSTHPEDTTQAAHDKSRDLWSQAKHDGITFLDEGTHEIRLANEASVRIYASPYTPEFMDWGFAYERNEDRFNPPAASLEDAQNIASNPVPSLDSTGPIDLLVTHGPPFAILDKTFSNENVGCPHLLRAVMRSRPLLHVFGHIHEGHGVERIQWFSNTDRVATSSSSTSAWKEGAYIAGLMNRGEQPQQGQDTAHESHGIFLDVSNDSIEPLQDRQETVFINAAIMNVDYRPVNAPFVVDMDLSKALSS